MIVDKLRRDYFFSVLLFSIVEMLMMIAYILIVVIFEELINMGLIIFILGSVGFWYLTIRRIKERYRHFMKDQRFRVITLENKLNYPSSFRKSIRIPLFVWGKAYLQKRMIIPKKFIGFKEGIWVYPIKEINEYSVNNHYEILYIYRGYAALIEDLNHKKYLIHIDNLEPIQ